MTSFTITDATDTGQSLTDNDVGFIGTTGILSTLTGPSVTASGDTTLVVDGTLASLSSDAALLMEDTDINGRSSELTLSVSDTGRVSGNETALDVNIDFDVNIYNNGEITGRDSTAIDITTQGFESTVGVVNTGTIHGGASGITLNVAGASIIRNSGSITSYEPAIVVDGSGGFNFIVNSGYIGSIFTAIEALSSVVILNSGVIEGSANLSSGDDFYLGTGGVLFGEVFGGSGNDELTGGDAADQFNGGDDNDVLKGMAGEDTLDGGFGNDSIRGGEGDDLMSGGGGDDMAFGNAGADIMTAGDGADTLRGGAGNDQLRGNQGEDILRGGSGDDEVIGGGGNDKLIGGKGDDVMTGGAGADVFVFRAGFGNDIIRDMRAVDQLDLSYFGFDSVEELAAGAEVTVGSTGTMIDFGDGDSLFLVGVDVDAVADQAFIW